MLTGVMTYHIIPQPLNPQQLAVEGARRSASLAAVPLGRARS